MSKSIRLAGRCVPALACFLLLTGCLPPDADEEVEPAPARKIAVLGAVDHPAGSDLALDDLDVRIGDQVAPVAEDGTFEMEAREETAGLALVTDREGQLVLLSVLSGPREGGAPVVIDERTTAMALAFLCPAVVTSDPSDAEEILAELDGLVEITILEDLLRHRLSEDTSALALDDAEISAAVDAAVSAWSRIAASPAARAKAGAGVSPREKSSTLPDTIVDPGNIVGGLQITHEGGDAFRIHNYRGRWAWCVAPSSSFYVFPNGTLLDAVWGRPWPPSTRDFAEAVPVNGEPVPVRIYGYGWSDDPDNQWDLLSGDEKTFAHYGGMSTVLLEFVPHVISLVTNTGKVLNRGRIPGDKVTRLVGKLFKHTRVMDKVREYLRAGKYTSCVCFLTKTLVKMLVADPDARALFFEITKQRIEGGALTALGNFVAAPVTMAIVGGDSLTSVLKTGSGFLNSRFRTEFMLSKRLYDFGEVNGVVSDKESGKPISGATVRLLGDEGSPYGAPAAIVTGESGFYEFSRAIVGEKTVTASCPGYEAAEATVHVEYGETTVLDFELEPHRGAARLRVLDEILVKAGRADPTYPHGAHLSVSGTTADGSPYSDSFWRSGSTFELELVPGDYHVKAWEDDDLYVPDEIDIRVGSDLITTGIRDLVLRPRALMKGRILLDMDHDGVAERSIDFETTNVGAWVDPGDCSSSREVIQLAGNDGPDFFLIRLDTGLVTGPGLYDLTAIEDVGCGRNAAAAAYVTERQGCSGPEGSSPRLGFFYNDVDFDGCNCGITRPGDVVVDADRCLGRFGTGLGGVIAGKVFDARVAASKTCSCSCCSDLDGDGEEDDWEVDCATARIEIEYRVLVGTRYVVDGI